MPNLHGDVPYGTLDLMLLKTLQARGPLHGFGLAREIESVSDDLLRLKQGSIYPALLRLQQRGLITASWGASESNRRAKFYALSSAGRKQLGVETRSWQRTALIVERFLALES
jgi:transcriptional regulator